MNYKSILFFLGVNLLIVSIFSIFNILYSIYFNFFIDLNSYLITFIVSSLLGLCFCYIGRQHNKDISLTDQIVFIVLSLFFVPLLISIPYFLSIYNISFLNAYFESVSGFTTTGFSIIKNIKNIDDPLVLWRSSSQWMGGLFFLIVTIGTIGSKQAKIKPAFLISGGASGRNFYNNFNYNFIKILSIYLFSTILTIFLYNMSGIRLLDSFNLSFTTISSGGFIPTNNLVNIIDNDVQVLALSISLLFPIFNFFLLHDLIRKQFSFRRSQEDIHLASIIFL